jgi:hypothetical protein
VRLRFSDPVEYGRAATALREPQRDDDALALQIPSGGSRRELRAVLDRLDAAGVEADELSVHTPDLDDVDDAMNRTSSALRSGVGGRPPHAVCCGPRRGGPTVKLRGEGPGPAERRRGRGRFHVRK